MYAHTVGVGSSGVQVTGFAFLVGKPLPFVHTSCIDGVGINVAPTVALTAGCIEIWITPIAGERIMGEMEPSMTLATRAHEGEVSFGGTNFDAFKGTGMIVVPVARGVVVFVHHANRIPYRSEYLKVFFIFLFLLENKVFFDIGGDV